MKNRKRKIGLFVCFVSLSLFLLLLGKYGHRTLIASNQDKPNTENTSKTTENESLCEMSNSESTEFIDTEIEADISSPKKELTYLEQCELNYVEQPVKREPEQMLQKIKELSLWFPALHNIYDNADKFTLDLLAALAGNPEMTDFAYGMLYRDPVATGGFLEHEVPEEYPLLLQWDIRWGYVPYGSSGNNVGIAGCGPTCLSMASFYLTGNRQWTPDAIAKYSEDNGYYYAGAGTAWALLDEFPAEVGLTSTRVGKTENQLKAELDKGNILICSVRLGNFTSGGHFIVIYGYDENGFKVNDPKCVYRSRLSWTYDQIKNDIKQTWSIGRPGFVFTS